MFRNNVFSKCSIQELLSVRYLDLNVCLHVSIHRGEWKIKKQVTMRENITQHDDWVNLDLSRHISRLPRNTEKQVLSIRCKHCRTKHPKALFGGKVGSMLFLNIVEKFCLRNCVKCPVLFLFLK